MRAARQARSLRVAIDTITLNGGREAADAPLPEASTLQQIAELSPDPPIGPVRGGGVLSGWWV